MALIEQEERKREIARERRRWHRLKIEADILPTKCPGWNSTDVLSKLVQFVMIHHNLHYNKTRSRGPQTLDHDNDEKTITTVTYGTTVKPSFNLI